MEIVLFSSRMPDPLSPEIEADYLKLSARMKQLAEASPGFISHKTYVATDGERMTIVKFESAEAVATWGANPEHRQAQQQGRERFYTEYRVEVCTVERHYSYDRTTGRQAEVQAAH